MSDTAELDGRTPDDIAEILERERQARREAEARAEHAEAEKDKLQRLISEMQRRLYGRRSEKRGTENLQFCLEDLEQTAGDEAAAQDNADSSAHGASRSQSGKRRRSAPRRNLGDLPASLPRADVVVEPEASACPCCGGELHKIGEDVSEQLDVIPARFTVKRICQPRMACRSCEGPPVQAPAPPRVVEGGLPTEALIAHIIVAKYLDHQPLYRQSERYAREGVVLDRATLAEWVGRAAWWLRPLYRVLFAQLMAGETIFADDTPVPVLDPGRGRTKTGRLWAYASDDRPWRPEAAPAVAYVYTPGRGHAHPADHLKNFVGVLQVDAFQGFDRLVEKRANNEIVLAHCWAHCRRKIYDVHKATGSPIAAEVLERIGELYAVEVDIRGTDADTRRAERQRRARPVADALKPWLEEQLTRISGKSQLAGAIRYILARWTSLTRYLDDGRLEIDTNTVERSMRPVALGRKNHLFAGSDGGGETWAVLASLLQTAKLNGRDPEGYLCDTLERVVRGHPVNRLAELLPYT